MIGRNPAPGSAAARLQFDPVAHRYTLDGRELPSVSTILRPLQPELDRIPRDVLAAAAQRGTWVHDAIALDLDGDLDEDSVPEVARPYFDRWREWRAQAEDQGWRWLAWERRVCCPVMRYAGTLDLAALSPAGTLAVIDHKTPQRVPRTAGPQTAGYASALLSELSGRPPLLERFALHLTPQSATLEALTSPTDLQVFTAALTCHHWSKAA